jgi:hypothetical protein
VRPGADVWTVDQLCQFAKAHSLSAEPTHATGTLVLLSGTYGQARSAFEPEHLGRYSDGDRTFIAREGIFRVPSELSDRSVAVTGFDDRIRPQPWHPRVVDDPAQRD